MTTLLLFIALFFPAGAIADDIVLRTSVDPAEAWVGQRVKLQVDVLGAAGWAQISRFGEIGLPGAYVVRTDSQGTRLQETLDGTSYTGQRYEVSVYPQRAGVIEIPDFPVEVTVKTWGADAAQATSQQQAPGVSVNVAVPPGAENVQGLVSTAQLSAKQQWGSDSQEAKVGDALQRTVTLQANDVSGMAFAPLVYDELPGVGIYPAEPVVEDRSDRGSLVGRRTESVTYVFERAGSVQIPEITLTWWNTSTEQLETVELPGREIVIMAGPVSSGGATAVGGGQHSLAVRYALMGVLAVVVLLIVRPLLRRWRAWLRRRRESEPAYFRRALQSVGSTDTAIAVRDLMRWLDRIEAANAPAQLRAFVVCFGETGATTIIDDLLQRFADQAPLADPDSLIRVLKTARTAWLDATQTVPGKAAVLPELNATT